MALITDPDSLNDGTEIVIDTTGKTIQLLVAGNLSTDGVTGKCVYSKLKELWKSNSTYVKHPFPIEPITDEQYEMINGWDWEDDTTRYLLRSVGWAVKDSGGVSLEEWAGFITLGSLGATDQVYYQDVSGGSAIDFQLAGAINQAVKIYGDSTHGNFDRRSYRKLFCREQARAYASSQLSDIGVTTMSYQVYRFPLSNQDDLKITHSDVIVDAYGVTITWYAAAQSVAMGGSNYNFHVKITGNSKTAEEIYEAVQSALRKATDIDAGAGTKTGNITNELLQFVGDTLKTRLDSTGGVYIDGFQAADTNRLIFVDDTGTERTYPFVAALTINFSENLVNDADAIYKVFFSNDDAGDNAGSDYGTDNAIIVNDNNGDPMSGSVGGSSSIQLSFDYDGNVQRGAGSAGEDAPITVVGIGLSTAQFVKATGAISRSTANSVSLVSATERVYENA